MKDGLESFKDYLVKVSQNPQSNFQPIHLLEIIDPFSKALHDHLAVEPQAILALSRCEFRERQFDLMKIEI